MNRSKRAVVVLMAAGLLLQPAAPRARVAVLQADQSPASKADDGWLGSWVLNLTKSAYVPGPAPYKRGTWTIERAGEDLKMAYHFVGVRGGVTHMEWTGRFDGAPHRLQGPDAVVTYAYTPVDDRTLDLVVAIDGTPSVSGRAVRSADGRTIVATTSSRTARGAVVTTTSVYERR